MKLLLLLFLATSAFAVNHANGNRASHPYEFVRTGTRRVNDLGSKAPHIQSQFPRLKSPNGGEKLPSKKSNGVPPYAVLMEPLVKYSQPDPLYDKSKEPDGAANTPISKTDLTVKKDDTKTDGQNPKQISSKSGQISSVADQEGESTNFHIQHQPPQIAYAVPGFLYEALPTEPEPIIEIIIKESNQSLPTPPPPPPPPKKKKKEQVQVFYVKYKKDPNAHYGEEKIIYDAPVPAVTPPTNNADNHGHEEEEDSYYQQQNHHHEEEVTLPPKPSTTLKAIIKPDSEVYHSTGNVHITFGGPHHDEEDHHHHHHHGGDYEEQSAPQPSVALPPKRKTSAIPRTNSESQLTKRNPAPFHSQTQPPQQAFLGPSVSTPREFHRPTPPPTFQQTPQFAAQPFKPQGNKIQLNHPPPSPTPPRPNPTRYSTLPQHLQQFQKPQQSFSFPPQPQPQLRPHSVQQSVQQPTLQSQQYYSINQPHLKSSFHVNLPRRTSQQYQTISNQAAQQHGFPERQQGPQNPPVPTFNQPPKTFPQPTHSPIPQPSQHHIPQPPQHHIPQPPQQHIPQPPQQHIPQPPQQHIPQPPQQHIPQPPQHHFPQPQQQFVPQQPHPHISQSQNTFSQQSSTFSQVAAHSVGPIIQRSPSLASQTVFPNKPPVPPPQQQQFQHQPNPQFQHHHQQIEQLNRLQQQQQHLQSQVLDQQNQNFFNQQKFQTTFAPEIIRSVSPDLPFGNHRFETKKPQPVQHQTSRPQFSQAVKSNAQFSTSKNIKATTESFKQYSQTTEPAVEYVTEDPKKAEEEKRKKEERKKQNEAALPKEVPDDLREQLLSSGILSNADIQILDYDKIGDIPIESLPPEALANFQAVAGSAPVPSRVKAPSNVDDAVAEASEVSGVAVPPNTPPEIMEMKVVRYNPDSKEGAQIPNQYVKEDATQLEPVVLNDSKYNRYLPLKVAGAQFPVPDVPELRGKNVTSVVVLAPVDYEFLHKHEEVENDGRAGRRSSHHVLEVQGVHFVAGDVLKTLVKKPTAENYRKWLDKENNTALDKQSVVLLVIESTDNSSTPQKEIFMYDIGTQKVSKLSGELSAQFVEVAESNSENDDLEEISDNPGGSFTVKDASQVSSPVHVRTQRKAVVAKTGKSKSRISPR